MTRVEIAGGGIGGLAAATALARCGLDVHVHERRPDVTEEGGAIVLFENMLRALERIGAADHAVRCGDRKTAFSYTDHRGRSHSARSGNPAGGRYYYVARADVHRSLLDAALASGVTVHPASTVEQVREDGTLVLAGGEQRAADLVVVADGVGSRLRGQLDLRTRVRWLGHWGVRVALDHPLNETPPGTFVERWSGAFRLGYGALPEGAAVYLSSPAAGLTPDRRALDPGAWLRAFPGQADVIRSVVALEPRPAPFSEIRCSAWSDGRVAVIGDAAHGMPPHRGQGAAMAVLDAVHLGSVAGRHPDAWGDSASVRALLTEWEAAVRPVVRRTQRNAVLYCRMQQSWPRALLPLRPAAFRRLGRTRRLDLSLLPAGTSTA